MSLADCLYRTDTLTCPHCQQDMVLALEDININEHEVYETDCPYCDKNVQFTIEYHVSFTVVDGAS